MYVCARVRVCIRVRVHVYTGMRVCVHMYVHVCVSAPAWCDRVKCLQGYIRSSSSYLQASRQIEAFLGGSLKQSGLSTFEQALGVAQHHDAVSGTSKQACQRHPDTLCCNH